MELAVQEMYKSIPEHTDRTDPLVGAVLATEDGELISTAHRGELRQGDHAEFTVLERKHRTDKLDGMVVYATLEPCAPGARSISKLGCAERIYNARIKKVYIGIDDPDPKVKGDGKEYLIKNKIEVVPFDKDLSEEIEKANIIFLTEAIARAKQAELDEVESPYASLNETFEDFAIDEFSNDALQLFRNKLGLNYDIESDEFKSILRKWNFIKKDIKTKKIVATGLGVLLYSKDAQVKFPQSMVKFTIKTKEDSKPKIIDFTGPLLLIPNKIEEYLDITFPKAIDRSTFARSEKKEVYFEVLREVIINAIVHRDYTIEGANVNVFINDEKIIIDSPGEPLVPIEKLQNFTAPSFSSNPKLANVFYTVGFIEKRNLGMEELHEFAENMGFRKPTLTFVNPYLRVTIWRNPGSEPKLAEIKEFIGDKRISSGAFASYFGLNTKTASRNLNRLVEEGVLGREGETRHTRYFLP